MAQTDPAEQPQTDLSCEDKQLHLPRAVVIALAVAACCWVQILCVAAKEEPPSVELQTDAKSFS